MSKFEPPIETFWSTAQGCWVARWVVGGIEHCRERGTTPAEARERLRERMRKHGEGGE